MHTPGSDLSLGSSESSADSTVDLVPAQSAQNLTAMDAFLPANSTTADQEDLDSDISMPADSDGGDGECEHPRSAIQVQFTGQRPGEQTLSTGADRKAEVTNKRKFEDSQETSKGRPTNGTLSENWKRLKPDDEMQTFRNNQRGLRQDRSLLPAEIWHHIFTFIPPRSLGLLLRVNKSFHAYLDASSFILPLNPLSRSASKLLKPDTIWKASRALFLPGMPAPLTEKSELDMWKLACSSSCQFCGRKQQQHHSSVDQWHPGPGENGNAPVWSFGVRICGSCLQKESSKELDLILSSSGTSVLMPALPFVFFTSDLHVFPATTLQNGQPPTTFQYAKHFFQPHIEEIKREFGNVQAMGAATAEEWVKGLDERGKERRGDALRWEKWESGGGIIRMHAIEPHEGTKGVAPTRTATPSTTSTTFAQISQPTNGFNSALVPNSTQLSHPINASFPMKLPTRFDSPGNRFGAYPRPNAPPRVERTKEEVVALKAARRAEIERRCMVLDPPLTAGVLAHMSSFQAAIQIIQPLDDGAWEVLKPRLLSQRSDAEQREKDRLAQSRVVQEHLDEQNRYQNVNFPLESKDLVDREWDDVQAPLRARLGGYADEIIRDGWNDGEKVSLDSSPTFAAEVLLYVRKRFYAEVAKDEAAVRATGREPELDPPYGPYTRKLILENMKWVFDTKIKPHTEQHRKELFLCNDCEVNFKYYGFEGVIQHFAAKHTTALSSGSIVVHWRAEWPEYPPFDPEPANASSKTPYYAPAPSGTGSYAPPPVQQNFGYGGYQPASVSAPTQAPNPHLYQESPGPYFGSPQFVEPYSGHQNGPFAPPPPQHYPDIAGSYQAQYPIPHPVGNGYSEPSQDYPQQGFGVSYPVSTQGMYVSPHPGQSYPVAVPEITPQQHAYDPQGVQNSYSYSQPAPQTTHSSSHPVPAPLRTDEYRSQLQDVARNARAVWDSIYNLKDVPGSVKVYVIIYHILENSRARFEEDPPLSMIIDGLSNNKDMRKVRNINGLLCKACGLGLSGSSNAFAKKHQSFPQLANHFLRDHEKALHTLGPVPDWTNDMIKLPDLKILHSIPKSRGMDDKKLKLIGEALPEIYPKQTTRKGSNGYPRPNREYLGSVSQDAYALAPSQDNHDKYYTTLDSGGPSEPINKIHDNGEYNPYDPRDARSLQLRDEAEPEYRVVRRAEDYSEAVYADRAGRSGPRNEQRPGSPSGLVRADDSYDRVILREEAPVYLQRQHRFRDEPEVQYRARREPETLIYDEPDRDHKIMNSRSYQSNRIVSPLPPAQEPILRESRYLPAEETATQQNQVSEVVAQISRQAQQARERQLIKTEPIDGGSEDGELQTLPASNVENRRAQEFNEASNAANRFLESIQGGVDPSPGAEGSRRPEVPSRAGWGRERVGGPQRVFDHSREPLRRVRDEYDEEGRIVRGQLMESDQGSPSGYIIRAPLPRESRDYNYHDRYVNSASEQASPRERSPELVDRRYKLNDVVYREERQSSYGMHRTPSRYARYESVRLENDRARSRSPPVYVTMGPQITQTRERSPAAHTSQPEPLYRSRSPQISTEDFSYERAPARQEFYRVYADEPRPRPQYVEAYELVQVSDPNGDYMIRRPVRRDRELEPTYARLGDERYTQQPVYETRPTASRPEPSLYEEYDPRNPGPPMQAEGASVRQREVRYQ